MQSKSDAVPSREKSVVDRIMTNAGAHVLICAICEDVILCGKGELRVQVELKLLFKWLSNREIILDYLGPNVISRLIKSRRERQKKENLREGILSMNCPRVPCLEDRGRVQEWRTMDSLMEASRGQETDLLLVPSGRNSALLTSWYWPSETPVGLPTYRTVISLSSCCFKPLFLWSFVTPAIGNEYKGISLLNTTKDPLHLLRTCLTLTPYPVTLQP